MQDERTRTQKLSKTLFGQVHRLSVMIAVARSSGSINPTDLSLELGLPQSALQLPLRDLVDAGLLVQTYEGRRNLYLRQSSKAWSWVRDLDAQTHASTKPRHRPKTETNRRTSNVADGRR